MTSPSRLPPWAMLLDAAAMALLSLAAVVAAFGGFRLSVAGLHLSVTSPLRPVLLAAVVTIARHLLVRDPSLYARVRDVVVHARQSAAVIVAAQTTLTTRLAVLAVGYLAVVSIGYPENAPPFRVARNELWNLPARWDSGWYVGIALEGYAWEARMKVQQNIAFFPAYPMMMRVGSVLVGVRPPMSGPKALDLTGPRKALAVGVVISLAAFFWAMVYLYRLARDDLDEDRAICALFLLATYPFAIYFSAAYTESLFLLGVAGAFYHFRHAEWARAGTWALLVGLTRPNGFFLALPLAVLALQRHWPELGRWMRAPDQPREPEGGRTTVRRGSWSLTPWAAAAMPVLGMLLYSAYLYDMTGRPFVWAAAHQAWGRTYRSVTMLISERYDYISTYGLYEYTASRPVDVLNAAALVFALIMVWPVARRLGAAYAVFTLVNVLPPLFVGGLLSMGRQTSVVFPVFIALAAVVSTRQYPAWIAAFAAIQGFAAVMFFTWRPLY